MIFDPTITMGAAINALMLLVGFAIAFTKIGGRIDLVALRLKAVETVVEKIAANDARLATMEERLTNQIQMLVTTQREVSDLRRGEGWITSHRRSVDGSEAY